MPTSKNNGKYLKLFYKEPAFLHNEREMNFSDVFIHELSDKHFEQRHNCLHVLRLDKIHPVVSGNKWFKLKYYLGEAAKLRHASVGTFGGAFSNHILATAYACNEQHLRCTGFIRGEAAPHLSQTLREAQKLNMRLEFISRADYKNKEAIAAANPGLFFIPEGGYGANGARGAAEILQLVPNLSFYDYIVCAAGTGTMLAGIANAALPHQQCIGISVMKNNYSLEKEIYGLIQEKSRSQVQVLHDFHFGGYAKRTQELTGFMNSEWTKHHLPLDFVYTAKALYAVYALAGKQFFAEGANILFIHSGGLQGNRSLQKGTLLFGDDA